MAASKAAADTPVQTEEARTLESGQYVPYNVESVTVWKRGEEPPDGFVVITPGYAYTDQNNVQQWMAGVAVRKADNGEIVRDPCGSAASIPEGGALVERPDGTFYHVAAEDVDHYLLTHEKA